MLSGMNRNAAGEQEIEIIANGDESEKEQEAGPAEDRESEDKKKKQVRKLKFAENQGEKTLDKLSNLNLETFDTLHEIDPLFRQTTQMFDEMSHWSRLCGMLGTSPELILLLDSRSENVANEGAEERRRSGADQRQCRNLPKEVCHVREQIAIL
jgi:hypothetical protein